jgi:ATP/ADP translocase
LAERTNKGKPTIDSLCVRIGDGVAALTLLVGFGLLALPTTYFFVLNVVLVLLWIAFAVMVIREHRRLSQAGEAGQAHHLNRAKEYALGIVGPQDFMVKHPPMEDIRL